MYPFRNGDAYATFRAQVEKVTAEINELDNDYVLKASPTELEQYFIQIVVHDLDTGHQKVLGTGAWPVYSPSGHVLYQTSFYEGGLWGLPFSIEDAKPTGEAFPVTRTGQVPSVAADGTLVYLDGGGTGLGQLVWRDRGGKRLDKIGQPQQGMAHQALSHDGSRVAVRGIEKGNADIWVHEVARPIKTRLTFYPELDALPGWSPDGKHIAFTSFRSGARADIFLKAADGSGEVTVLVDTPQAEYLSDWSQDGNYICYSQIDPEMGHDLWYLRRDTAGKFDPVLLLQTPFNEYMGRGGVSTSFR